MLSGLDSVATDRPTVLLAYVPVEGRLSAPVTPPSGRTHVLEYARPIQLNFLNCPISNAHAGCSRLVVVINLGARLPDVWPITVWVTSFLCFFIFYVSFSHVASLKSR